MRALATTVPEAVRVKAGSPSATQPASVTDFRHNAVGLAFMVGAAALMRGRSIDGDVRMLVLLGAVMVPIAIADFAILKVHRRASTGLDWDRPFALDVPRVLTKLLGLALTVGTIALAYWVFPEYHGRFYDPFYRTLERLAVPGVVLAIAYVAAVDGRMREPRDTYWQLGRFALGHFADLKREALGAHARAWLVKAFFLPLMIVYLRGSSARIIDFDFGGGGSWENLRLYDFLYDGAFLVDLTFCVVGYTFSFRAADSHVRSAEPTVFGWLVALMCYQPFFSVFDRNYLAYGGPGFGQMLAGSPVLRSIWAAVVIALVLVYVLATVAFGLRFSNLTHRGVLTNGPYRFTKHPAYISKNLSWWMTAVPFAVAGGGEAVRHVLMLLCLNMVYFLRARTEERHLSKDPRYVAYALWMNEHGMLRFLGRWFPFLRYTPPKPGRA